MALPTSLARAVQQIQEWLKELRDNGDFSNINQSLAVLRVVLHQLRDRLTVEEAVDLGAQLPLIVRGIYYAGWQPHKVPRKANTKQKFVDEVVLKLRPHTVPAERAVRDVFALMAHHCDAGEISDVIAQLPKELKELWPEIAQTFRARTR